VAGDAIACEADALVLVVNHIVAHRVWQISASRGKSALINISTGLIVDLLPCVWVDTVALVVTFRVNTYAVRLIALMCAVFALIHVDLCTRKAVTVEAIQTDAIEGFGRVGAESIHVTIVSALGAFVDKYDTGDTITAETFVTVACEPSVCIVTSGGRATVVS
jgi:hypothetical protein